MIKTSTIRIPKTEFERLNVIAKKYELLRKAFTTDFFETPSVKNRKPVIEQMRATGRYSNDFLKSLDQGLKESHTFSS